MTPLRQTRIRENERSLYIWASLTVLGSSLNMTCFAMFASGSSDQLTISVLSFQNYLLLTYLFALLSKTFLQSPHLNKFGLANCCFTIFFLVVSFQTRFLSIFDGIASPILGLFRPPIRVSSARTFQTGQSMLAQATSWAYIADRNVVMSDLLTGIISVLDRYDLVL